MPRKDRDTAGDGGESHKQPITMLADRVLV